MADTERSKKIHTLGFRADDDLKKALQELALADKRKTSQYVQIVLEEHVDEMRKQGKLPPK